MLSEDQMAAWAIAVAGLLFGYAAGNMFIPSMIRSVSGASMTGDIPAGGWALINIVLVWGLAVAVATVGYKAIKRG